MDRPQLGSRALFPDLQARAYVNHAGISPPSAPVQRAVADALGRYAEEGAFAFPEFVARREALRARVAGLIHAQPHEIGLLASTTAAVVAVATCFPWRPGDRVVVFDGEFPTNVTPWQRAAALHDLLFEVLPTPDPARPDAILERLSDALRRGVRLVAVSAVQFQSGLRMPLAEIGALCRTHGAALFVDAIQACGVVPIDVHALGIDFLACGTHKWLMGTEGAAFLYARDAPELSFRPHLAGWLSHENAIDFLFQGAGHLRYDRGFKRGPTLFEIGSYNTLGFVALQASLELLLELGIPQIFAHVQAYHDELEPELVARGFTSARATRPDLRSGVLSFRPPRDLDVVTLPARLREHGVVVAIPDGWVRFSPHWPNALDEVAHVVAAIDALRS